MMLVEQIQGDDLPFTSVCRAQGWKRTVQRRAVWNCLCGNREHPSVEMVWQKVRGSIPDVSLDSIYRILDDFAAAGIIRRLEGSKVIRYDSDTKPHEHFICTECSRIFDFAYVEQERVGSLCREFGSVESVELTVRGMCRMCLLKRELEGGHGRS